ncbi:MAG: M23 family metallopeptidase [Deltaproteobacteria bacterium]|nr:M23 family metallopeptidase [Deltaproteobacteria bacterium]
MVSEGNISIHPPLEGEWKFLRSPGHHPFAFDFVQMDHNRKAPCKASKLRFFVNQIPSNKYYSWGKPVYAPIDGTVIRLGNGWQDHEYTNIWKTIQIWYNATYRFRPKEENGRLDIRPNAGNHVMIKAKEGYIVFLAHLKNQSILVKEGQHVRQGEVIGMVGNSGNSTAPHLHINLFDQMDNPLKSKVLPFVFSSYELLSSAGRWVKHTSSVPKVGAFVRFNA